MRFTTLSFLIFFLFFYIVYWNTEGKKRLKVIVLASLAFYAAWSIGFTLHFLGTTLLNYYLINRLHKKQALNRLVPILAFDFVNLFLFKYFYFFLETISSAVSTLSKIIGISVPTPGGNPVTEEFNLWLYSITGLNEIVLPLAISFYTFQLAAYAVDVYRGDIKEKSSLLHFLVFILFFPQLVAGPIMRHFDFYHQLTNIRPDRKKTIAGIFLLMQGTIKKVVIADNAALVIRSVFAYPELYDRQTNIMALLGFSVRVYCDFSGYTDIARGLGKLLGLDLPENFRGPYLSSSLRELWQRWHVTLSTWIRDYLYIPLGGSRQTELRNFTTIFISFSLAGLWHGPAVTYLLWGSLHGLLLGLERVIRNSWKKLLEGYKRNNLEGHTAFVLFKEKRAVKKTRLFFQILLVFFIWMVLSIPFNAPGLSETIAMTKQIFGSSVVGVKSTHNEYLAWMFLLTLIFNAVQKRDRWPTLPKKWEYPIAFLALFFCMILLGRFSPEGVDFIYFQF